MAGIFDAVSSARERTSDGNLAWTHTPVGVPTFVVVHFAVSTASLMQATEVWYGTSDVQLSRLTGSPTTTGAATVDSWYKIGGIPTGAQTVTVIHAAPTGAEDKAGIASSYLGGVSAPVDFTTDVGTDSDASLTVANTLGGDLIIEAIAGTTSGFAPNSGQSEEAEQIISGTGTTRSASYNSPGVAGSSARSVLLAVAGDHAHHAWRFPSSGGGSQVIWY